MSPSGNAGETTGSSRSARRFSALSPVTATAALAVGWLIHPWWIAVCIIVAAVLLAQTHHSTRIVVPTALLTVVVGTVVMLIGFTVISLIVTGGVSGGP